MNERDPLSVAVFGTPGLLGGNGLQVRAKLPVVEVATDDPLLCTNTAGRGLFNPFATVNVACIEYATWPPPPTSDADLPFAEEIPEATTDDIMKDYRPS